jgi:hypothetical protein
MNGTAIARIAKICALVGFFLPWALVSCSGQPIASASGLSLAMGDMPFKNPMNGVIEHQHTSPNLFLLLAMVAIVGGLALSFGAKEQLQNSKQTARALLIGAGAAAVLSVLGMMTLYSGRDQAIAKAQSSNQFAGGVAAGMIQVKTQFGFWVTLVSLAVAAGASGLIITDRETLIDTLGSEARRIAAAAGAAAGAAGGGPASGRDDDERYWDRLSDKNDPSALEEYLHRFPQGRFSGLARARLERSGVAYAAAPVPESGPAPAPSPAVVEPEVPAAAEARMPGASSSSVACPSCRAPWTEGDRFCSACGSALIA